MWCCVDLSLLSVSSYRTLWPWESLRTSFTSDLHPHTLGFRSARNFHLGAWPLADGYSGERLCSSGALALVQRDTGRASLARVNPPTANMSHLNACHLPASIHKDSLLESGQGEKSQNKRRLRQEKVMKHSIECTGSEWTPARRQAIQELSLHLSQPSHTGGKKKKTKKSSSAGSFRIEPHCQT